MKNKKIAVIFALIFVLLLGGASALYKRLGRNVSVEQLSTQPQDTGSRDDEGQGNSGESIEEETASDTEESAVQRVKAPDFVVYDAEGNELRLSDYEGKPVVLNFWASWCGPCRSEMPEFNEKYQELKEDVQFLMVNLTDGERETVRTASAFVEKGGYSFPVAYDQRSDAAKTYGIYSIPTTYFIDAEGYAAAHAAGAIDADTLQRGIDMILK